MNDELNTLKSKGTFELANCSIIKSKLDLKKQMSMGRHYQEEVPLSGMWLFSSEGMNFDQIFSLTLQLKLLKLILMLALTNNLDYEIDQVDIKCAFLNANLQEEICIHLPDGANELNSKVVMRSLPIEESAVKLV